MNHEMMPQAEAIENTYTARRTAVKRPTGYPYQTNLPHAPRHDKLTAQRVDVGMIFLAMLGTADAADYMLANAVPPEVVARVLAYPQHRRRSAE